ncbi:N-acetylmuramoyl-L-alanine amidase [Propionibacterium australiense]|uniref:N-acetylmuramoyl-L-alanine amidase n=1 Tax=Propionibacterium australiense TaxID=119981 RepID=A0A8B3FL54_9ACTN|nr:N-acetylmuramoyl-L-alanine amidase [Propionibacterium australiense]RLP08919.1 N-acetylmuramoyl-L-alanine amidase [Propionibacterium australiense]
MDWANLIADVDRIIGVHYSPGREGRKINKVVLHHNAGRLTIDQCYNTWQTREASAHYQVEHGGRIGQLVNDSDTAWHAGDWETNLTSIGIEHANERTAPDWTISDATLDAGAHLVAAICRYYGLGRPQWQKNVFGHRDFSSTSCPGALYDRQIGEYMRRAQAYYDGQNPGTVSTATAKPASGGKPALPANYPLPWPLPQGHYYGPVDGPEDSHGGYYAAERPQVRAIQQALIACGYVPGITDTSSSWADGVWEQPTTDAVVRFQRDMRPTGTDRWGEFWADDCQTLRGRFA